MKKFVVLILLLGVVSMANAGLEIVLPAGDASPATIDVMAADQLANVGVFLGITGGSLDISAAINAVNEGVIIPIDDADILAALGVDAAIFADLAIPAVPIPAIPDGAALSGIVGTLADGVMEAPVVLIDGDSFEVLSSATIVPEPMTFALLGLGGLFLRRRK